jgi:hypothetical protein
MNPGMNFKPGVQSVSNVSAVPLTTPVAAKPAPVAKALAGMGLDLSSLTSNPLLLIGGAAAAWYFFFRKKH